MIDPNHECFKWEWKTSESSVSPFIFSIKDGVFGYTLAGKNFHKWWSSLEDLEIGMQGWVKVRNIEAFGPFLPPVHLKIREMYKRRGHVKHSNG